jgi:integrase
MNSFPGVELRENSIRLSFTTSDGVRHKKTYKLDGVLMGPTGPNAKAAARLIQSIKAEIQLGEFSMSKWFPDNGDVLEAAAAVRAKQRTVAEQLDHYLTVARIEKSTRGGYQSAANFWKRSLRAKDDPVTVGATLLSELIYSHLQFPISAFPGSGKTVNNYLSVLCKALHVAVRDGQLEVNPAADEELRSDYQEPEPDPFDAEEVERIIDYMGSNFPQPVYNVCDFWAHSGLRTSEIYGALWPAIDWSKQTLLVHRTNVRGQEKETTKTNRSRHLPLNSRAMAALKRQKLHTFLAGKHVFQDPRYGKPWDDERAFRRSYWTPALKALGIRYRSPYQLRHTFATMMLMAGVTPAAAAKRMGHSVQMFLTRYTKWLDGDLDAIQNERLEAFLAGNAAKVTKQVSD